MKKRKKKVNGNVERNKKHSMKSKPNMIHGYLFMGADNYQHKFHSNSQCV